MTILINDPTIESKLERAASRTGTSVSHFVLKLLHASFDQAAESDMSLDEVDELLDELEAIPKAPFPFAPNAFNRSSFYED